MKSSLLVYILGFLLILALAGFGVQSCENRKLNRESQNTKRLLLRGQKRTEKQIDSMVVEQKILEAKGRALTLKYEASQKELELAHQNTKRVRKEYEKSKNSPAPLWKSTELDSIIDTIIN